MIVVSDPSFEPETHAFLERVGTQDGPLTYDELLSARVLEPDPELAGKPEPIHCRAEVLLPLTDRSLRVRIYRPELTEPRPVLLWLHGGGFVAGTLDDVDVTCSRIASKPASWSCRWTTDWHPSTHTPLGSTTPSTRWAGLPNTASCSAATGE